ncbi:haloacid dehalogenase [Egicoccus halophilus]|uniref:Haloacid dehalogenase n=1 Tax=Egicoccus halophilus TaxID=1670830 RepID=A0A8J3ACG8_9ACTN|nr:haloacid dehalogenase [Egicoccus halophilus]GGI03649.1 haloacid dehalogenase [Egicoccus halophilus]
MSDAPAALAALTEPVRGRLVARHEAREVGLDAGRDAIRAAANAIRATHRAEHERAATLIDEARSALAEAYTACGSFPDVLHAGFVQDAAKEVAEAVLTRAAVRGEPLPSPDQVGVDDVSWLHGLAETVGELRRASLDHVRGGRVDEAEAALGLMQEILAALVTIDVPDGLSRGLRRATDAARAITERTRGDLTTAAGQRELRRALDAHREALQRMLDRPE